MINIRLELLSRTQEEDRLEQIEKIQKKLTTLQYAHILDIADNIWWGAKKFYDPTKEYVIPKEIYERIQKSNPELLI